MDPVSRAHYAALNYIVFDKPLLPIDFHSLGRFVLQREWQRKWNAADTFRFDHFEGQRNGRKFVSNVSRIRSGHCTARSHLSRFKIVEEAMCLCLKGYETVDPLLNMAL
jgi:hypothetical protein